MKNLMKAEWFKLSKSFGFKVLCLCNTAAVFTTGILALAGAEATGYEAFVVSLTYVLHHAAIECLFVSIFVCREFSNRTFGMLSLCGYSRKKVFLSKILVFSFGWICLFLIYTGAVTIVMSIANGFGCTDCTKVLFMLLCGILGYAAMGMVIICIAVIVKKAFVTVGIGMGAAYALLWIETNLKEYVQPFVRCTYTYQIGQLQFWDEGFSIWLFVIVTALTFVTALAASICIFDYTEKLM